MSITKDQAQALAVRYQAFMEALDEERVERIRIWARLLKRSQEATGVELISNLDNYTNFAQPYPDDDLTELGDMAVEKLS